MNFSDFYGILWLKKSQRWCRDQFISHRHILFPRDYFDIILLSMSRYEILSPSFRLSGGNFVCTSHIISFHYPWFNGHTILDKGTEQSISSCHAFGFYSGGSGSNLARDTNYPDWGLPWLFSVPPGKYRDNTSDRNSFIPHTSQFIIHQSTCHSTLYGLRRWQLSGINWKYAETSLIRTSLIRNSR
jgi:hypothetical protein